MDISRLQVQLQVTKLQNRDRPLYQLLHELIGALKDTSGEVTNLSSTINNSTSTVNEVTNNSFSMNNGAIGGSGGLSATSVPMFLVNNDNSSVVNNVTNNNNVIQLLSGIGSSLGGLHATFIPMSPPVSSSSGVTSISIATANGLAGSSSGGSTPILTLSTTITGILLGNGTAISAAVAGDFPTLNQNTTGSAGTLNPGRNINGVLFDGSANITVTAAAGTLTGTVLNATVVDSSLTSVGTLTGGATGAGFTIALSASTVTGTLADARLSSNVPLLNAANVFTALQTWSAANIEHIIKSNSASAFTALIVTRTAIGSSSDWEIGVAGNAGEFTSGSAAGDAIERYSGTKRWANGITETLSLSSAGLVTFRAALGQKIELYPGAQTGFGIQTNLFELMLASGADLIVGSGASGSLTQLLKLSSVGILTVAGFGVHAFNASAAGFNSLRVRNSTAGTASGSSFYLGNDESAVLGGLLAFSSTYTDAGAQFKRGIELQANGAGGLSLSASDAAGVIRGFVGGIHGFTLNLGTVSGLPQLGLISGAGGTGAGHHGTVLFLGQNSSGGGAPGVVAITDKSGANQYIWADSGGLLRIGTTIPDEAIGDTGGIVVGRQTGTALQTYTETNVTTDRAFNANATTIDELADVLGTLIFDLRAQGLVS